MVVELGVGKGGSLRDRAPFTSQLKSIIIMDSVSLFPERVSVLTSVSWYYHRSRLPRERSKPCEIRGANIVYRNRSALIQNVYSFPLTPSKLPGGSERVGPTISGPDCGSTGVSGGVTHGTPHTGECGEFPHVHLRTPTPLVDPEGSKTLKGSGTVGTLRLKESHTGPEPWSPFPSSHSPRGRHRHPSHVPGTVSGRGKTLGGRSHA